VRVLQLYGSNCFLFDLQADILADAIVSVDVALRHAFPLGVHLAANFVFQSRDSALSVTRATLTIADAQVYVHTTTMTAPFFLALRSSGLAL